MDNDIVKNNDPLQLQQMIIFLRAELAKYKNEVKRLRDSDYYALVLRLERENIQLTRLRKDLSMELLKLKRDFDKELEAYDEELQKRELQRKKQIASIESLLKELSELRAENKLLKENIDVSIEETNYKSMMEALDKRLNDFTIVTGGQMERILETIEQSYRNKVETDSLYEQLVKELETKNLEIEKLTNEIKGYKNQSDDSRVKMNESINIDEQIDFRLRMLDELDQKLNELAFEINRE
ncbi:MULTISPECIES: hypothetical protein [Lysinibacillus]|uniref:Uncharacterized protein n=1 Tax=Lysinibacillus fusiformis TaxID=28031 RepID=A0A1H9F2E4_9BACI|nr:hypothetical protein [Lysinibacillus fusiformis]HAU32967.1 hypothetical protein [Lysinibacillus sp.]MCG7436229.1 hypothetical protein [Lysinibacillus fusiformis]SCX50723.1 hypothetical protein SAMN02787108_01679 [Lysinibacillus fusiformis]SCY24081.1 hypothetical protein SAMN02787081_01732 [Lysinibacillus fusiformis]SDB23661.1 hypothetical protein SAMN02787070_01659 [Lysinibacillus fusiformis]